MVQNLAILPDYLVIILVILTRFFWSDYLSETSLNEPDHKLKLL